MHIALNFLPQSKISNHMLKITSKYLITVEENTPDIAHYHTLLGNTVDY